MLESSTWHERQSVQHTCPTHGTFGEMATKGCPAVDVRDLWFSYEVAENRSTTAKVLAVEPDDTPVLRDGGLSIENPRKQHDAGTVIAYKLQLKNVSLTLPRGARCVLVGANGAGKSTLISVVGGRRMVSQGSALVHGRAAFDDTTLAPEVALLTGNWTHTVSFVGHNVPYQAMEVSRLVASHAVGVDPARVQRLVSLLEVSMDWNLTEVSDGQRRRVQILCKLIKPASVLLLDEVTTDLDLLARQALLGFLREEADERGVTIVYCTHIFDGLDGWPTHVSYLTQGELKFSTPAADFYARVPAPPPTSAAASPHSGGLFRSVHSLLLAENPRAAALLADGLALPPTPPTADALAAAPVLAVRGLSWSHRGSRAPALHDVSFDLPRGARALLVGANGAGKTTLLRLLGGKHMLPRGTVEVLGYSAFHDTELNPLVSLLSGDWTRSVACVGNGVPFQADFSVGHMARSFEEALVRDGHDAAAVRERLDRLTALLGLDLDWRLHQVSDGQRRRAQLLLKLLRPSRVLLLDEVTTDLDLLARQALLGFLREEADERGVTVVYSTHIFDGLDGWPTHVVRLSGGTLAHAGPYEPPAEPAEPRASASGSLYTQVRGWFDEARRAAPRDEAPAAMEVDAAPAAPAAPAPAARTSTKFDRFGGSSRQGMYC